MRAVNEALARVRPPAHDPQASALPILYVVGAPRSGTTLLAQLLIASFRVGFVSNLVARFHARPSVGVALHRMLCPADEATGQGFDSIHGVTGGAFGQHEFGYFWRRWLGLDAQPTHHPDAGALARVDRAGLRSALEDELLAGFGLPLVLKNLVCGFHAPLLCEVHPASLFVHVERNEEDVVRSILAVRRERFGRYDAWWSLKPSGWPFATTDGPAAEVRRQVQDVKAETRAAVAAAGAASVELSYEELCRDPRAALERVAAATVGLGASLETRQPAPAMLAARSGPRLEPEQDRAVRALFAGAEPSPTPGTPG